MQYLLDRTMFSHLPFSIGNLLLVVLILAIGIYTFGWHSVMYFSKANSVLNIR